MPEHGPPLTDRPIRAADRRREADEARTAARRVRDHAAAAQQRLDALSEDVAS